MIELSYESNVALQNVENCMDRVKGSTKSLNDAVVMPSAESREACTKSLAQDLDRLVHELFTGVDSLVKHMRQDLRALLPNQMYFNWEDLANRQKSRRDEQSIASPRKGGRHEEHSSELSELAIRLKAEIARKDSELKQLRKGSRVGLPQQPAPVRPQDEAKSDLRRVLYNSIDDTSLVKGLYLLLESLMDMTASTSAALILKNPEDDLLHTVVTVNTPQHELQTAKYPSLHGAQGDVFKSGIALNIEPPSEAERASHQTPTDEVSYMAEHRSDVPETAEKGKPLLAIMHALAYSNLSSGPKPQIDSAGTHYCRTPGLSKGCGILLFPVFSTHPTRPVGVMQFTKRGVAGREPGAPSELGSIFSIFDAKGKKDESHEQPKPPRTRRSSSESTLVFTEADELVVGGCKPMRYFLTRCQQKMGRCWFLDTRNTFHGKKVRSGNGHKDDITNLVAHFSPVQKIFRTRHSGKYVKYSHLLRSVSIKGQTGVMEVDAYMKHLEECWRRSADDWVSMESTQTTHKKDATRRRQRLRQAEAQLSTTEQEKDEYRKAYQSLKDEFQTFLNPSPPPERGVGGGGGGDTSQGAMSLAMAQAVQAAPQASSPTSSSRLPPIRRHDFLSS